LSDFDQEAWLKEYHASKVGRPTDYDVAIYLWAAPGDRNAARGLIGRALRKALGIRKWNQPPQYVGYARAGLDAPDAPAHYSMSLTPAEFNAVMDTLAEMKTEEGWDFSPFEVYADTMPD
jgi:hypothetical protein